MKISVRVCELRDIASLRGAYRQEMDCQIIHDSIHSRPGWSVEYLLSIDGKRAGYGSVAVAGPWRQTHALYEFYAARRFRLRVFDLFEALTAECSAQIIETQTNDPFLAVLLHTYGQQIRTESILFEDAFTTRRRPKGAAFREATAGDAPQLKVLELDDTAGWVVTQDGEIAGAGGVLYHYNRPYGDVYMKIAEPFRRKGLGAYLVQELKRACREGGSTPAARCNVANRASRRTLQKAGFAPCGNMLIAGIPG